MTMTDNDQKPLDNAPDQCGNCRFAKGFWWSKREQDTIGLCQRHAPRPMVYDDDGSLLDWNWPQVSETLWCGEHERR